MLRTNLKMVFATAIFTVISSASFALPNCLDNSGKILPVNNAQVLKWKTSTQNQFHGRGHVQGELVQAYSNYTGHNHFEIQIGPNSSDTIEIVYNESFGALPRLQPGMSVEICGDYITTGTQGKTGSPDGAILHWVHNSNSASHPSGYVAIDGVAYGDGNGNGGD